MQALLVRCEVPTEIDPASLGRALRNVPFVTESERERARRYLRPHDTALSLVSRWVLRNLLSHLVPRPPCTWAFRRSSLGRPQLVGPHAARLDFNLSHTRGAVLVGVARDASIGVDTESTHTKISPETLAPSVLAPSELEALHAVPPAARRECFLRLWTLKESLLKARGTGLSTEPTSIAFRLTPSIQLRDDASETWRFASWRSSSTHFDAVALSSDREALLPFYRVELPERFGAPWTWKLRQQHGIFVE